MTLAVIILESDDVVPVLIGGLIVRVFSTTGIFITSATTDVLGEVSFDIPDADYDLTFFKAGVSLLDGMPQRITVDVADTDVPPNTFKVKAHVASLPESPDPMLCRISGSIRGADGRLSKDIRMSLGMSPEIAILSGIVISPQDFVDVRPDDDGYYEFNLLRTMKYRVYFPQLVTLFQIEPAMILGIAPDLPALSLTDFLFPVPVLAEFDPLTLSVTVGDDPDSSVECTITYSDGSINTDGMRPVPPAFASIRAVSSDDEIATADFLIDKVVITAKAPGMVNVTIARYISETSIIYDPLPAFSTQTLVVTVT